MFQNRLVALNTVLEQCIYSERAEFISPERALEMAHFLLHQATQMEGTVYLIGNGGSSAIASHFCTDFLRTLEIAAATLSDASTLSCFANDFGYENVYKMPLERLLKPNDLLIAISSSGKSSNIVEATKIARERRVPTVTLTGFSSQNPLRMLGDLNFWLDSTDYGLVETGHFFLLHTIVDTCKTKQQTKSKTLATSVV